MTQLNLLDENSLPANVADAIAWTTKKDGKLVISFKMETPIWIGDKSLVQWLRSVAEVGNHGLDGGNVAIEVLNPPNWLIDEARNYKSKLGGSNHPLNEVRWNR